ncbi:DJ-1/PfpI family protein [Neorhizobium galegae]|uniref:ThiJ/PfpI domain protein n=1 Tax=Neorhizobium galegae bv. orientalis str. HAMBI 540 TaxID=1028800 RepID=A0A068T3U6_NEOGA|nr:DJ-1/PfpI family protein [Neorhizobium galegae]CDN52070.1 ThiJ/PfpI domain protein [Neorhizobium galegae bv. orientalis str. HAMBI 540]CDZ53274.1 ThiJ/PfpI domain protein [Neorhizobium galegae bv. orientalis]
MTWRFVLTGGLGLAAVFLVVAGGWIVFLPSASSAGALQPIPGEETRATVEALKPTKRVRPVVAVVGINDGTEITDYLMPYGILRRADVADVVALATQPGPMVLYPALKVEPQATIADFDAQHPEGADYVIVPAMVREDDPAALRWIRSQAEKGAVIVGVCVGAKVVAATGLLDGRKATTHWYSLEAMLREHPSIRHVADRRFLVDGRVATTTGISASMPMSLTLIEAIAGREKAEAVAAELGVANWDARHASGAFTFTRPFALTAIGNSLAFWNRETLGIELSQGVDEVSLALVADAWSRTYRSRVMTFAASADVVESRNGIRIIPDEVSASTTRMPAAPLGRKPAEALDDTLKAIAERYRENTADFVAMQLEYRRRVTPQ